MTKSHKPNMSIVHQRKSPNFEVFIELKKLKNKQDHNAHTGNLSFGQQKTALFTQPLFLKCRIP